MYIVGTYVLTYCTLDCSGLEYKKFCIEKKEGIPNNLVENTFFDIFSC